MPRSRTDSSTARFRSNSNLTTCSGEDEVAVHPVDAKARTPFLPPVMVSGVGLSRLQLKLLTVLQAKSVDEHPLSWLGFEEDCIMTACNNGESKSSCTDLGIR